MGIGSLIRQGKDVQSVEKELLSERGLIHKGDVTSVVTRRKYPEIGWVRYLTRWAAETKDGKFWCDICGCWVNNQRWAHYKKYHLRYI